MQEKRDGATDGRAVLGPDTPVNSITVYMQWSYWEELGCWDLGNMKRS